MKLSHLPRDILALILDGAQYSFLIIDLWKCGDSNLNSKLSNCITTVRLKGLPQWPCRFPFLLGAIQSLRHLTIIHDASPVKNPIDWQSTLNMLPKTLESLSLCFPSSSQAFLNIAPDSPPSSPIYIETKYNRGSSTYFDLDAMFPALQSLEFQMAYETLPENIAPALPSRLRILSTGKLRLTLQKRFFELLPPSIEVLDCCLHLLSFGLDTSLEALSVAVHQMFSSLPPNLHRISSLSMVTIASLQFLPKHIEYGELRFSCSPNTPMPPYILKMRLMNLNSVEQCLMLPRHLREVTFTHRGKPLSSELISALPSTLTSLKASLLDWNDIHQAIQCRQYAGGTFSWPPHLELFTGSIQNLHTLQLHFPTTIRTMYLMCEGLKASTSTEPLGDLNGQFYFNPNYSLSHPSTEVEQSVMASTASQPLFTYPLQLPSSLTDFSFEGDESDFPSLLLPYAQLPNLLHLHIGFKNSIDQNNTNDYNNWPFHPQLNLLQTLQRLHSLQLHLRPNPSVTPQNLELFNLPKNLRSLKGLQWHLEALANLPRSLTELDTLNLSFSPSLNHTFLDLPSRLTSLWITKSNDHIELVNATFSHLNALIELNILPWSFPSSILRRLPKSLRSLRITLTSIEEVDMSFLPRSITRLDLGRKIDYNLPFIVDLWPLRCNASISLPSEVVEKLSSKLPI